MRIVSDFRDYYDQYNNSLGVDRDVVFTRKYVDCNGLKNPKFPYQQKCFSRAHQLLDPHQVPDGSMFAMLILCGKVYPCRIYGHKEYDWNDPYQVHRPADTSHPKSKSLLKRHTQAYLRDKPRQIPYGEALLSD